MKNKKGFLLAEETLKIVLAVIAISFLISFLTSLYFAKVNSEKLKQAEAILKGDSEGSIKMAINSLEDKNSTEFHLQSPKGWYLFGFVGDEKPNSCAGENCLCICDKVLIDTFFGIGKSRQAKECSDGGTCLFVQNLKEFDKIKIKQQFISIKKIDNNIEIIE